MKILIFGTVYCDTAEKWNLAQQWADLHGSVNPDCDLLLVDSCSPRDPMNNGKTAVMYLRDNIGHLSRGGQDGWGRAFCTALQYAIDEEYTYAVHIEGDSLCNLPIRKLCEEMSKDGILVGSMPVEGTKHVENNWVETGFMTFDVEYVDESNLIEEYNWQDGAGKKYPNTPEAVLWKLTQHYLHYWPFDGMRDDCKILTPRNVDQYEWISHTTPDVYETFVSNALERAA